MMDSTGGDGVLTYTLLDLLGSVVSLSGIALGLLAFNIIAANLGIRLALRWKKESLAVLVSLGMITAVLLVGSIIAMTFYVPPVYILSVSSLGNISPPLNFTHNPDALPYTAIIVSVCAIAPWSLVGANIWLTRRQQISGETKTP
jgi:hypothetical protein